MKTAIPVRLHSQGPTDNIIMVWCWIGAKALPEPMMTLGHSEFILFLKIDCILHHLTYNVTFHQQVHNSLTLNVLFHHHKINNYIFSSYDAWWVIPILRLFLVSVVSHLPAGPCNVSCCGCHWLRSNRLCIPRTMTPIPHQWSWWQHSETDGKLVPLKYMLMSACMCYCCWLRARLQYLHC